MRTESDLAYLDSSALVKLVIEEAESAALRTALRSWPRRVTSRLAVVEVVRACRRRSRETEHLALCLFRGLTLVGDGDLVLAAATLSEPPELRALDAIHLASAVRVGDALAAFVSYDRRQLEAAAAAGLPVVSPS